jgi:hypothetical protein
VNELPLYQCHKQVRAAKIIATERIDRGQLILHLEGGSTFTADIAWLARNPLVAVGGYFVQYQEADKYTSYSPAGPFEGGYTPVPAQLSADHPATHIQGPVMRAKLQVSSVQVHEGAGESLKMNAVCRSEGYPDDGSDEDNSYARWSPSASFEIYVANPNLFGKFAQGDKFYVDFTKAEK